MLDLIEQLGVGDAIPSERQLSADLGVSRLTVRAALDELVREGYLVRRRGSGTFVERAEDRAGADDDLLHARTCGAAGWRRAAGRSSSTVVPAGAHLGRLLHVSPSEPVVVVKRLRLADRETMAIETLHVRESLVPGLTASDLEQQSFYELLAGPLRDRDRRRPADDRADGHERGGVGGARRAAALAGVPVRAHDAIRSAARSSSTCARSTAATATGSSPS